MSQSLSNYRFSRYYKRLDPLIKDKRAYAYWLVILSLCTISFFGIFAVRPTLKTISMLRRQIDDLTLLDTQLEDKINALIDAQEAFVEIEPTLPLIYSLLPQNADFPRLLRHIELLADNTNATVSSVQVEPVVIYSSNKKTTEIDTEAVEIETSVETPEPKDNTLPLVINFTVKGDYANVISFLTQMTKIDRIVSIDTMNLTQDTVASDTLSLNIKARAFYFPEMSHFLSDTHTETETP